MNAETKQYLRQLRSRLPCPFWVRRRLMAGFLPTMELHLQDNPEPSWAELCENFGSPTQMARVMLEWVPESERRQYQKSRVALRCIAYATAAMLGICCIYVMFFMEIRRKVIHVVDEPVSAIVEEGSWNADE